jgi:hypothetical protein
MPDVNAFEDSALSVSPEDTVDGLLSQVHQGAA